MYLKGKYVHWKEPEGGVPGAYLLLASRMISKRSFTPSFE
jgi:hypothetical protein